MIHVVCVTECGWTCSPADYLQSSLINCDSALEVDDGWILSGVHCSPTPQVTIVTAALPLNGDYHTYLEAGECVCVCVCV